VGSGERVQRRDEGDTRIGHPGGKGFVYSDIERKGTETWNELARGGKNLGVGITLAEPLCWIQGATIGG